MSKRLNQDLKVAICVFIGVNVGHAVYVLIDFIRRPDFYASQSAPWYIHFLPKAIGTAVAVGLAVAVKKAIHRKKD